MTAPRLIIPMGDPAGIGAEVTLKALGQGTPFQGQPCSITLVGDRQLWQDTHQQLLNQGQIAADPGNFPILHQPLPSPIHPGHARSVALAARLGAVAAATSISWAAAARSAATRTRGLEAPAARTQMTG